jgi:tetratricopeptide (TPR) repeat protein
MIRRLGALPLIGFLAASMAAQQPAATPAAAAGPKIPDCPIDVNTPKEVAIANLQRQKLINATNDAVATAALRDAIRGLYDSRSAANPLGRDWVLAQILTLAVDHGGDLRTRGDLGLPGANKTDKIDMLFMIDSLMTIVEKGNPQCVPEATEWRQYHPYSITVQAAYKALNAGQTGAADSLARRALMVYRDGVQPYDILWRTAKSKGDEASTLKYLQLTAEKLSGDTINAAVRSNLLYNLGRVNQEYGDKTADPAKKAEYYRASAKWYLTQLTENPTSDETSFSLSGISAAAALLKDSTLNLGALKIIMATPEKYDEMTLAQAGVIATRVQNQVDAVKLFSVAAKLNPYSRDYLYNVAATLYDAKQPAEMIPVVRKLLLLDPGNPDNLMLYAYAYNGLSKAEKDPAKKKMMLDSMVFYNKTSDEMPQKVTYVELGRLKDRTLLKGQVENRTKLARTVTIDFEFLDKNGAVMGTKQTTIVGPIAAGATKDFALEFPMGGVYGVRYAPLPSK